MVDSDSNSGLLNGGDSQYGTHDGGRIKPTTHEIEDEDERRLNKLGYLQELKRIFGAYTNFCLTASMVSILLGIIPLYPFGLTTGGPPVMFWSWLIIGSVSSIMVLSLAEIASAYPTMGALYYWAYRMGGKDKGSWGPFASWMAGWTNLLGQIAGLASGSYSGAQITVDMIYLINGTRVGPVGLMILNGVILIIAGIVNTFAETLLTGICYISAVWGFLGVFVIVIWMLCTAEKLQDASFVFGADGYNNDTGFSSIPFVCLIGSLAAASTFTGYDTAAHIAEETQVSHLSTPYAMIGSTINALVTGKILLHSFLHVCCSNRFMSIFARQKHCANY